MATTRDCSRGRIDAGVGTFRVFEGVMKDQAGASAGIGPAVCRKCKRASLGHRGVSRRGRAAPKSLSLDYLGRVPRGGIRGGDVTDAKEAKKAGQYD